MQDSTQSTHTQAVGNFGEGRYSAHMKTMYGDAKVYFQCSPEQADRLARSIGAELGRIQFDGDAKVAYGKITGKGEITVRGSQQGKLKTTASIALRIGKIIMLLNEAQSCGMDYHSAITLSEEFHNWLFQVPQPQLPASALKH